MENKFACQARFYAWAAGITGAILSYLTGEYKMLFSSNGIGETVMLIVWFIYTFILTFEKRIFKVLFSQPERLDTARIFKRLNIFHWFVLGLSLVAVFIGVLSGHGWF